MRLRQSTGDAPPFARREVVDEGHRRPWRFPITVGELWRAQTAWDQAPHADPVLAAAKSQSERRQKIAIVVYIACLGTIFVAGMIGR